MRVLILGGTAEASAIARGLAGDARFDAVLSYAGRTVTPKAQPIATRSGGFGGAQGLAAYLVAERMDALVDATHPFATTIKHNAWQAANATGTARLAVLRAVWTPVVGDRWTTVADMAAAMMALGPQPRRVFLTIGQQDLAAFGPPHSYLTRSVDPPPNPPANAVVVTGRGPFDCAAEVALMQARRIDIVVTKQSGGSTGKLQAARELGLPVLMVARPPPPPGPLVTDAVGALDWLHHQAALRGV